MKKLIDLGFHFIGFRDEAATLKGKTSTHHVSYMLSCCLHLHLLLLFLLQKHWRHAKERADALEAKLKVSEEAKLKAIKEAKLKADDLEAKLKTSETARKKAEKDASGVEDLRGRLQAAEDALSDKEAKQVERESAIIKRLETQSRRFSSTTIFPLSFRFFLCKPYILLLTKS
jgi:small-conductance mechanosensitive channel